MHKDSVGKTIAVAIGLCLICSILVSTAAVKLRPLQAENKRLDIKKNLSNPIYNKNTNKTMIQYIENPNR